MGNIKILYIYYSESLPKMLPYTFFFLRQQFSGEAIFLTNEKFPNTPLFEQYNIVRINGLDQYSPATFYNEYKVHGIRDFACDDSVYMDIDIFCDSSLLFETISTKQNFFANKFWSFLMFTAGYFFDDPPPYGYNGGIIRLDSKVREKYTAAAIKMFEKIRPFAYDLPVIQTVAEEYVAATIPEISVLGKSAEQNSAGRPAWVHLMEPTDEVLQKLQIYKEYLHEKNK